MIKSNCIDGINVNVVSNSHPPYKKFHGILIFFLIRDSQKKLIKFKNFNIKKKGKREIKGKKHEQYTLFYT